MFKYEWENLSSKYCVNDLIPDGTKILFILESPHIEELKHGAPVSGSSGISMAKHLFGQKYGKTALGILLKENTIINKNDPLLNKVGLMNVCQIPMQEIAYPDMKIRETFHSFLSILGQIRTQNQKDGYQDQNLNQMQELIIEHFSRRLKNLVEHNLVIIPCGNFANKFFRLANVKSKNWNIIEGVPHPSYNLWDNPKYQTNIKKMKSFFK